MTTFYGGPGAGYEAGASQFAGGGFMPRSRATYDNRNQTLRALTIKQLHDAQSASGDDQLSIDGRDVSNVTVVGKITAVEDQNLVSVYTIDDGTGTIQAKYWIPEQDDGMERQLRAEWQVGVYVRAHGHVNTFNRERMLVAFNLRRITDLNEVTYHGLQVVFQHLYLTRGAPAPGAQAAAGARRRPRRAPSPTPRASRPLGTSKGEAGVSVHDVQAASGGRYAPAQLREVIEQLQDQGRCYSTTDDEHFRAVE
ncbi:hypothetical protein QBZ16_001397 [Prototheca wickerhamii]|uniref:Uncharacterized protein n=1 Tax=Prototheca wickerhamii TaxID=3111 RepID=A0AAD9IEK6_PROWI|nr:hypothetical protein QBZ16_001397 [Prototheca wickerhamii]